MKKTYKQTKWHRRLGKVMTMSIAQGDGVQVFACIQTHPLRHMKCVYFFLYHLLLNKAVLKRINNSLENPWFRQPGFIIEWAKNSTPETPWDHLALVLYPKNENPTGWVRDVWWGLWDGWVWVILQAHHTTETGSSAFSKGLCPASSLPSISLHTSLKILLQQTS